MTVKQLKQWLRGLDDSMQVIVCDGDNEFDAVFTVGHDESSRPVVVIDLTADCEREEY